MTLIRSLLVAAVLVALPAGAAHAALLPPDSTALLSGGPSLLDALETPVGSAVIGSESVSQDGRFVVFESSSDGLSAEDDDRVVNIYLKDTLSGKIELMSRRDGADGEASHSDCTDPAISDNAIRIAFACTGSLDPADKNTHSDVYVRVPDTGTTALISRDTLQGPAGNQASSDPTLSETGTFVAFSSSARDLDPETPDGFSHVYRWQFGVNDPLILVSRRSGGGATSGLQPSISDDGSKIAYATGDASDPAMDKNNNSDVYLRDVAAGTTTLVSRQNGTNQPAGAGASSGPAIAGDGSAVAFESEARLDARDKDAGYDVYKRSLKFDITGAQNVTEDETKKVGNATAASIDDSGNVVGFVSDATGLDPADTDPRRDAYVRDASGAVGVASRADGAAGAVANRDARRVALSGDGKTAAIYLEDGGITPDADPRRSSVIRRDLIAKTTRSVARPAGPDPFVNEGGESGAAVLSADGRYAAFSTEAAGLGLPREAPDGIVVRDRVTGDVTLVSRRTGADGAPFTGGVTSYAISADGRRVAFGGRAVPGASRDVYVRDLDTSETFLANVADGPAGARGDGPSDDPVLDADGTRVAFTSSATNLGNGDPDAMQDIHVRDLETGDTILVSRGNGPGDAKGDDRSHHADIDAAGNRVTFVSEATNLADGDPDAQEDTHLRDLGNETTVLVSATPQGVKANADTISIPSLDAAGQRVAFGSAATNLGDPAVGDKIFVRDLAEGTVRSIGRGFDPVLSPDGGFVAFTDMKSGTIEQVWRRDLATGAETLVSRRTGAEGTVGERDAYVGDISARGACVTFSTKSPLIGPDRDPFEGYLRTITADCGDTAPGGGAGPDGPNGGDGPGADPDGPPAQRDLLAPVLSDVRVTRRRFRPKRGTVLQLRTSEAATVTVDVERRGRGRAGRRTFRRVATLTRGVSAGEVSIRLRGRVGQHALRRGRYRLRISATDSANNRSTPVLRRFRVAKRRV